MLDPFHSQSMAATMRTLRLRPGQILRDEERIPVNLIPKEAQTARPTWIGQNYRPRGVLLLGKNPGGGSSSFQSMRPMWDEKFFQALERLKIEGSFGAYIHWRDEAAPEAMVQWPMWLSISAVLDAIGIDDLNSVAIGNLVPFRTSGNSVLINEYRSAWKIDTYATIELLRPKLIVKMTSGFEAMEHLCPKETKVIRFNRTNGDKYISQAGLSDLARLNEWREETGAGRV